MNIAKSSFYYQPRSQSPERVKMEADLLDRMEAICMEFPRYGYQRVTKQPQREGWKINHKRVLRLMKESNLLCGIKRKCVKTTDSKQGFPGYPNLLQGMVINKLNQVWIADITYIRIRTGFVYLATILDACSRKVIGHALSTEMDTALTLEALRMAIAERQPGPGVIHHLNQGVQYASREYVEELWNYGFKISMARKGNPYENAMMGSFFKTLKYEEVNLCQYETFEDMVAGLPHLMEEFTILRGCVRRWVIFRRMTLRS